MHAVRSDAADTRQDSLSPALPRHLALPIGQGPFESSEANIVSDGPDHRRPHRPGRSLLPSIEVVVAARVSVLANGRRLQTTRLLHRLLHVIPRL